MNWKLSAAVIAGWLTLVTASLACGAEIAGTVAHMHGKAVTGAQVGVRDAIGNSRRSATTDGQGHYQITGLTPGKYDCVLDAYAAGLKGGRLNADLSIKNLTINWKASASSPAVAEASQGIAQIAMAGVPSGLSPAAFGAAVAASTVAAAGGVMGGYAVTGGFSSSSPSPSL